MAKRLLDVIEGEGICVGSPKYSGHSKRQKVIHYCHSCDTRVVPWKRGTGTEERPFYQEDRLCWNCADPYDSDEAIQIFGWEKCW